MHEKARIRIPMHVEKVITRAPTELGSIARSLVERYGSPNEIRDDRMIWRNNGPWSRTILHYAEVEHRWPHFHSDVLEQRIPHAVGVEQVPLLAEFLGSLAAHRTVGELVVRCADERANFLAVNLAHEILDGACSPYRARVVFAEKFPRRHTGASDSYVTGLRFGRQISTADPDEPFETA